VVLNSVKTTAAEMKAKKHDFCLLVKYFNSFLYRWLFKFDEYFKKYEIFITGVECCNKITLYID
jgi:hypothetical protein